MKQINHRHCNKTKQVTRAHLNQAWRLTRQLMLPSRSTTHSALMSQGFGCPFPHTLSDIEAGPSPGSIFWQPFVWSPMYPLLQFPHWNPPYKKPTLHLLYMCTKSFIWPLCWVMMGNIEESYQCVMAVWIGCATAIIHLTLIHVITHLINKNRSF